jgi:serine/threonine-protein kinase HipA
MHSLGGLIHSDYNDVGEIDYKDFITVAKTIGCTVDDTRDIFKRMVFNLLAVNHDDHVKNFSFLMDENGRWSISPAYDMTYIQGGKWTKGHQMTCNGKENEIKWDDMKAVADACGIKDPLSLAQEVENSVHSFEQEAKAAGINSAVTKTVLKELKLDLIPKTVKILKKTKK